MYLLNVEYPTLDQNGTILKKPSEMKCLTDDCVNPEWDEEKLRAKNKFDRPILKNVVLLPPDGYSIVRFRAENPGWWPFHCHQAMHNAEGMMLIFHIEDKVRKYFFKNLNIYLSFPILSKIKFIFDL